MSGTKWRRSDQWVGAEVEDSFVMVNIESGKYVSLNRTANAVWRALETTLDEDQLCQMLIDRFEIDPEGCRRSLANCLGKMQALEIAAPL